MMRILLAGSTAAALLAGTALAQTDTSTTRSDSMSPATTADSATSGTTMSNDGMTKGDMARDNEAMGTTASDTPARDSTAAGTATTATGSTTMDSARDSSVVQDATVAATPAQPGTFIAAQSGTDRLASSMIGQSVVNPQDETVGDIADLVMDRSGRVTAAVIGVGGFLGIGEKNVGVPIEALEPRRTEDGDIQMLTMLTREDLERAPEFVDLETKATRDAEAARDAQRQQVQQPAGTATTQ